MIRTVLLAAALLGAAGCIPFNVNGTVQLHRDRANIRQNILITGQPQRRFQSVWGAPTRTYSRRFEKGASSRYAWTPFGGGGSFEAQGGESYDLWFYAQKEVTLVFNRERLAYWNWGADPPDSKMYETDKIR